MGADTTFGETNFNPDKPTKKVQWSGYGELGNISQKPPSPSSATAEEILQKYMDMSMIICPLHVVPRTVALDAMHEFAALQNKPQPTAEGAEEILKNRLGEQFGLLTPFGLENLIAAMTDFATLHSQQMAEKMKEASQFILDIARVFGIETDGVGFDGLTLSIDDFREAAGKIVEEKAVGFADWLSKLQPSQKVSVWSKNGEHRGLFTMDNEQLYKKYLKSIEP